MAELYRTASGQDKIRQWCSERLAAWPVAHETMLVKTHDSEGAHILRAGAGRVAVVYLPGSNFNSATSLRLLSELAAHCQVFAVDLPGQPGLSTSHGFDGTAAQGAWISQVLGALPLEGAERVVLVGHSRGAHVALSAEPTAADGLVLLSPAGFSKAAVSRRVLRIALPWMARPTPTRSRALVNLMSAADAEPDPDHVNWLTMVAQNCRTTGAPGPIPRTYTDQWRTRPVRVLSGDQDCFFPLPRLAPSVRDRLGTELEVLPGVGHLSVDEAPNAVVDRALSMLDTTP